MLSGLNICVAISVYYVESFVPHFFLSVQKAENYCEIVFLPLHLSYLCITFLMTR